MDAEDVPPVSSANDDQPDEIDPDSSSSDAAAGEILTVKANGSTVSGSALEIVGRMTQNEVGHTFAPEAIRRRQWRLIHTLNSATSTEPTRA